MVVHARMLAVAMVMLIIVAHGTAQVRVLAPNGGEVYDPGTTVSLRWSGTNPGDSIVLSYSIDDGGSWIEIDRGRLVQPYAWTVPNTPSTQCLWRIEVFTPTTNPVNLRLADASRPASIPHMSIDLTRDGRLAIVADEDGHIMLFDAVTGALLRSQRIQRPVTPAARVVRAVFSSDETWIAALTEEDSVVVARIPDLSIDTVWHTGIPRRVALEDRWIATQPGGDHVAVSSFTRSRTFTKQGVVVADISTLNTSSNTCVDWTPDGASVVASSGAQGHVLVREQPQSVSRTFPTPSFSGFVSPDGRYLVSQAKNTQAFMVRDLVSGDTLCDVPGLSFMGFGVRWYPDNTVARITGIGTLERYTVSGAMIDTVLRQPFGFNDFCFDSTGLVIGGAAGGFSFVVRSGNAAVRTFDVSDGRWEIRPPVIFDTAWLWIDTVATTTLQDVSVPIRLVPVTSTALTGVATIRMDIQWNATIAAPIGTTSPGVITGLDRTVTIDVPVVQDPEGIVARLDLRTALGNDSVSALRITNVQGVPDPSRIITGDGRLVLTDICEAGGVRYLNGEGAATIRASAYADEIDVQVTSIESGPQTIMIVASDGRVVRSWCEVLNAGRYRWTLPRADLARGLYIVVMITPTMVHTTSMGVFR